MNLRDRVVSMERMRLADLASHPKQPRVHPEAQLTALDETLQGIGMAGAALAYHSAASGKLTLIDGHGRKQIAGDETWPVLILDLSDEEADRLLLTFDAIGRAAGYDDAALDQLLREVGSQGPGLDALLAELAADVGLYADEAPEVAQDEVPEPPDEPVTRLGDVWLLGRHRVICGDCTDPAVVGRVLDGATPFLMVTDPPYGVEYDPAWRTEAAEAGHLAVADRREGKVANDDRVDWREAWALFTGDVAYVWHADRRATEVAASLESAGLEIRAQIIWAKPRFAISRGHYHWQHEPCWYAFREGNSAKWQGGHSQTTMWEIGLPNGEGDNDHGTQKPIECMARPIRNHGGPDDAVYDPFLGSGTTLIAAEQLGRVCYGCELEPRYVDVIVRRWEQLTGEAATREPAREEVAACG